MSARAEVELLNASGEVLAAAIGDTEEAARQIADEVVTFIEDQPADTTCTLRVRSRTA